MLGFSQCVASGAQLRLGIVDQIWVRFRMGSSGFNMLEKVTILLLTGGPNRPSGHSLRK